MCMTNKKCEKCHGRGSYMYDENHAKPCEVCCTHSLFKYMLHIASKV